MSEPLSTAAREPTERPLAIVDIDGVLADVRHRLHHVEGRPKNWRAFFAGIPQDPPLDDGLAAVRELARSCEVVYVTGRPEYTRGRTQDWLARHGLPAGRLVMRPAGDHRPARVAKPELVRHLADGRTIAQVVDDDAEVCEAMRAEGWPVRHAQWMPVDPASGRALRDAQERRGRT